MTTLTNKMRQAYLMAALDTKVAVTKGDPFVARSYVDEKVRLAFNADCEEALLGRLDLQRQQLYSKYLRELNRG